MDCPKKLRSILAGLLHRKGQQAAKLDDATPADRRFAFLAIAIITLLALSHVWVRDRVNSLTLDISATNKQIEEAGRQKMTLEIEINNLKAPARVENFAREQLGMETPVQSQLVKVTP